MDLIYQIFAEIEKAKIEEDYIKIEDKQRELDALRVQLHCFLKRRGITERSLSPN